MGENDAIEGPALQGLDDALLEAEIYPDEEGRGAGKKAVATVFHCAPGAGKADLWLQDGEEGLGGGANGDGIKVSGFGEPAADEDLP